MNKKPKVSVIIPVYNVEQYLRECLDSVINQTLKEIEIICVNDGSTDNSLSILKEYAINDSRIKIIDKPNAGYGHTMNVGLDNATGEYIGIVESDDFVELDMYEKLYNTAIEFGAEAVKSNYFIYESCTTPQNKFTDVLHHFPYNSLCSTETLVRLFTIPPSVWTGIYSASFLRINDIRYLETPGAAFQDTGMSLKILICVQRLVLLKDAFYHYRRDRDEFSINNNGNVFSICEEYAEVNSFLNQHKDKKALFELAFWAKKFSGYKWNYFRLTDEFRYDFLCQIYIEFSAVKPELLSPVYFIKEDWIQLNKILNNMDSFFQENCGIDKNDIENIIKQRVSKVKNSYQVELRLIEQEGMKLETENSKSEFKNVKVSVVIPVYNTAPYLRDCLDSIIEQTLQEIEIICINDGSTDNCGEILEEYAKNDSRIHIVAQTNRGLGATRNVGINLSHGVYIYFMDSDDVLNRTALDYLYNEANLTRLDVLYFDADSCFETAELQKKLSHYKTYYHRKCEYGEIYSGEELFNRLHNDKAYRVSACLQIIRRQHLLDCDITFPEGVFYEDNTFNMNCMLESNRVSHRQKRLYVRYVRSNSIMTSKESFRNVYGYFKGYLNMLSYIYQKQFLVKTDQFIRIELNMILNMAINCYKRLSQQEQYKYQTLKLLELKLFRDYFLSLVLLPRDAVNKWDYGELQKLYVLGLSCTSDKLGEENPMLLKVSVIIPVYNATQYLRQCLDSIVNQTLREIEIICVDDGSTDNSLEILREYEKTDKRFVILTQKNEGAGAARNKGLKIAKGEYLSFLDSDDFFELTMLEDIYAEINSTCAEIVIFRANSYHDISKVCNEMPWGFRKQYFPFKKVFSYRDMPEHIFLCFQNWSWNKVFKTTLIRENNITFQELYRTNDIFFTCIALVCARKITTLDKVLVYYRVGMTQNSQSTNHMHPLDFYKADLAVKDRLKSMGIYREIERSFLNAVLSGAIYNMKSNKNYKGFLIVYDLIRTEMEHEFAFLKHPKSYYVLDQYDEYQRIKSLSLNRYLSTSAGISSGVMKNLNVTINHDDKFVSLLKYHYNEHSIATQELSAVYNSLSWKITAPLRRILGILKGEPLFNGQDARLYCAELELDALYGSLSWKITAPLRKIFGILKGLHASRNNR